MSSKLICNCNLVTTHEVKKLINSGFYLLSEIAQQTGATQSCGRCKVALEEFVAQHLSTLQTFQISIDWGDHMYKSKKNKK